MGAAGLLWVLLALRAPHVLGIHCDPPPAVPNSRSSNQREHQFPLNSVLRYRCLSSFRLIGEATLMCVSKNGAGSWDKAPPVCEYARKNILCREPVVPGGYRDRKSRPPYVHGDAVTFTCNANFTMKGHRTVWCQASGSWGPLALPVCESDLPMECPSLPALHHGQHTGETTASFVPGISVNSSCQPGYMLVGPKTISCLSSGEWSAPLPTCKEARCQPPGPFPHGRVQEPPSLQPGSVLSFSCDEGYRLLGKSTSHCVVFDQQANWTKMPQCEEIRCSPPPPVLHGTHSGSPNTDAPFGSTVSYTCDPGPEPGVTFVLVGEATLRCIADHQHQGVWNGPAPRCEMSVPTKPCPPPQISRGHVSAGLKEGYAYNDTVQFACQPGFTLKGSPRAHCQASGTWHPAVPVCEKACPAPPQVPNGRQEGRRALRYEPGTSVSYRCDPGFELAAAGTVHCSPDGLWMPAVPRCQEAKCTPDGQQLFQRPRGHFIRTPVSSSCGEGFQLGDSVFQPCQGTELWFVEERLCKDVTCPPPPRIHNGTHSGSPSAEVPYGTTVTYRCLPGPERGVEFALVGEHTLRCISAGQAGGKWSGPAPTCRLSLPTTLCPPVHVDNGYLVSGRNATYSYNASVVLVCKPGFTLKGSARIRCGPRGSWDPKIPVCEQEIPCQPTGDTSQEPPAGARVVPANASCQDGFRQTGFAYRKCEDTGQGAWFQKVALCEALQCPPPPPIDNGKHSGGAAVAFPYGSHVTYACEPGFHLRGQETLQCGGPVAADPEAWSGPAPQCLEAPQARSCPGPEVRHGRLQSGPRDAYPHHSEVHVECDPGFIMNGSQVIRCQPDNTWAPAVPTCIKRALQDCPPPLLIPNGNHTGRDRAWFPPGMSVLYGCDQGYLLEGVALLVCTVAGNWSQPTPFCIEVNCSSPAQVEGVQRGLEPGRTYQYGAIVTVECADGYTLEGSSQSQCEDGRAWNPPLAVCRSQGPLAPILFGLSAGLVLLFCLVVVAFCMILKHKERYYTSATPKEDLKLETREVYSMGHYDPAS
ncbi:complement receptor type 2 isoform X2 [Sorex fumeus]|uniref:complement receptor type 2 isoform X2 n=1 Tax=Sorex fumeus TaxID=62283 RepID=UPI0024AE188C|nr:complement receptor type 2 isoform X2 [Sorex fumeus]